MTDRLYAKYLWLINTVNEAGKISFEEIASKWNDTYINDLHQPLRLRTFHNHRMLSLTISRLYYIHSLMATT